MTQSAIGAVPGARRGVVYLVRHGQTALNADDRLRGHLDPPLDEAGVQEVLRLARALGGRGITSIVSSPLRRAQETARVIAAEAGLGVSIDDRLRDRDYGRWTGERLEDVRRRWGSVDAAPGVEPRTSVGHRVRSLVDDVSDCFARAEAGGTGRTPIVLVGHDAVNRILLASLDPELGEVGNIPQRTACWNELVLSGQGWSVIRLDEKDEPIS